MARFPAVRDQPTGFRLHHGSMQAPEPLSLPIEDIFTGCDTYRPIRYLGSGASGFVFLAEHVATSHQVALKFVEKQKVLEKYLAREILHHRMLNHPHIVKFHELIETTHYLGICMEYVSGGSLLELVRENGQLREGLARWIFQQLMIAVDYCHRRSVVSRDLKLENTLLQRRSNLPLPLVKICDFGYSKSDQHSPAKSRVGSLVYMPPEVVSDPESVYDGKKSDIWACGIILYTMLYGRLPFLQATAQDTIQAIMGLHWTLPTQPGVSEGAKDLLSKLLRPMEERIGMNEIYQHPWFLTRLADGAFHLNDHLMQQPAVPPNSQSEDAIQAIMDRAQEYAQCAGQGSSYDAWPT